MSQMSALELSRSMRKRGFKTSGNVNGINSYDYYLELYRAILRDFRETGKCQLIDNRINEIRKASEVSYFERRKPFLISWIEGDIYSQLYSRTVDGGGVLPSPEEDAALPKQIDISDYSLGISDTSNLLKMLEYLTRIADEQFRKSHAKRVPDDRLGDDARGIRIWSKEDERSDEPGKRAEESRGQADTEAAEIIKKANEAADNIRKQAREDAESIRNRAAEDADKIRTGATEEAARILAAAKTEREQKAQQSARELIRKYMASGLNNNWAELREEIEKEDAAREDALTRSEQERREIWIQVSSLQGSLVKAMEESVNEINRLKLDLCQELDSWRGSLHVSEFDELATVYAGLARLHNDCNGLFGSVSASSLPEDEKKDLTGEVERQINSVGRLERQMDRALSALGMYPIRPVEGDPFNGERHELTDKQLDDGIANGEGYRIMRCVTPGVAVRYREAMKEDRILRKAKVEVDPQSRL